MAFDYKQYFGDIVVAQDLVDPARGAHLAARRARGATPSITISCSTSAATSCAPRT